MQNDFRPEVGHKFTFRTAPLPYWNGVVDAEVLLVEPHVRLAYRWDASGDEAADGLKTVVNWTLTPVGLPVGGRDHYQGTHHGWQRFVADLERVTAGLP